jgi:hypothetical protein
MLRARHMYRTKHTTPDIDSFTPLTALSARQALERTIRDQHALEGEVGTLALDVAQVKRISMSTAEAVAAHLREEQSRPRMSPAAVKAWGLTIAGVMTAAVTGITQWRVAEAGAEARSGGAIAAQQTYDQRAKADREQIAEMAATKAAKRAAEEARVAVREEQMAHDRAAAMRGVAPRSRTR